VQKSEQMNELLEKTILVANNVIN